jgi:hypothetical protein
LAKYSYGSSPLEQHHEIEKIKILHSHVEPAVFVCKFCDVAKVAIIFKPSKKENFGDIPDLKVKRNGSFYILGHTGTHHNNLAVWKKKNLVKIRPM